MMICQRQNAVSSKGKVRSLSPEAPKMSEAKFPANPRRRFFRYPCYARRLRNLLFKSYALKKIWEASASQK
ncbi:hypothetical protein CCY99_04355 [Helicobacter sp. 16-1353]|nr:hypothetical protein CCY99_04355 [Helicobacter sp. 16-1353]